jgi:hypothetical protein
MRPSVLIAAAAIAAAAAFTLLAVVPRARIPSAYKAKALCSEAFLAGRSIVSVAETEFENIDPVFDRVTATVHEKEQRVDASLFGLGKARARYRDSYGCTIESGALAPLPALAPMADGPLPESFGDTPTQLRRVDYSEIAEALDRAFADRMAAHRAIVVLVDGRIVAERYAEGFDAATPMLSWSMAKSVTATLVGAAALNGYLAINDPAPVPEWRGDAAKSAITWNDLLRMQSGLAFTEIYDDPSSDVSEALFRAREAGAVAARKPLTSAPGKTWSYSSGTTNLIMRTLRQVLAERGVDLQEFARARVFAPIGAASFVLEPDSSGTPIGSSYVYATARDWAKLGQLYLEGGAWNGEPLLPEGWSAYVSEPTLASDGEYGAHFWLNRDGRARGRFIAGLPEDMYYMAGHEGQYVFIIPDRNAVVVRLGMTRGRSPLAAAAEPLGAIYRAISEIAPVEAIIE